MKILSVCGSPRKGNSETILLKLQKLLEAKGVVNEIILLRKRKIGHCLGCVEYCNHKRKCQLQDDLQEIMEAMGRADGFIFISPNYFKMPTGIFKDFIDRLSITFAAGKEEWFKNKKAVVIAIGTDSIQNIDICLNNIAVNFCQDFEMEVVAKQSFRSHSELNGNFDDILISGLNPDIEKDLEKIAECLSR